MPKVIKEGVCPECGKRLHEKGLCRCECGVLVDPRYDRAFLGHRVSKEPTGSPAIYGPLLPASDTRESGENVNWDTIADKIVVMSRQDRYSPTFGGSLAFMEEVRKLLPTSGTSQSEIEELLLELLVAAEESQPILDNDGRYGESEQLKLAIEPARRFFDNLCNPQPQQESESEG